MKSRFAILSMLVAGMLFSTAGAGLALSGKSNHQASVAQYSTPTPTPPPCTPKNSNQPGGNDQTPPGGSGQSEDCAPCTGAGDVAPSQNGSGSGQAPECTPTPEGGVLPAESGNAPTTGGGNKPKPAGGVLPAEATQTQPTRQEAAATNSQLPFTGFAAIPVLLGGLALLTGGLILRRRTRSE